MPPERLRTSENLSQIDKKGVLPDGRSVVRLQGSTPDAYGFYLADKDSQITRVNTQKALSSINELLSKLSLPPTENIPDLFVVIKSGEGRGGKDNRVQFVDVESANQRKDVTPFYSDPNGSARKENIKKQFIDAEKIASSNPIHLENDYYMIGIDGRLATVDKSTGELHSPHFRRCSAYPLSGEDALRIIPQLSKSGSKKWINAYAKEIKRRLITSGLPDHNSSSNSYDLAGIGKEESQMLSMTFDEWKTSILEKNPSSYWQKQAEDISTKVIPEKLRDDDIPPHMNIASVSQKREFMTVARIASLQKQTYRDIARKRKNEGRLPGGNEPVQITSEDIRQVQTTITPEEIQRFLTSSKEKSKEKDGQREENSINFLSITGLPHEWLGVSEEVLKNTPQAETPLIIANDLQKPTRNDSDGMFTRAAQNLIENPENLTWGGKVQSVLTPEQVADRIRILAETPLVTLEQLRINPNAIASSEERAKAIWKILTSRQIENKGTNVRTPEGEEQIIEKIKASVSKDEPVDIIIFGPLGTAPSQLRTGKRTQPHLGHLDFLTQFARINSTVEQVYSPSNGGPAMRFHWVNETGAFVPNIMRDAQGFEDKMKQWVNILNPDKEIFRVYHMNELLWDTLEKRRIFEKFRNNYVKHTSDLFEQYERGDLPDGKDKNWVEEKSRLIYPIATIIDPYDYLPQDTPLNKIAVAYEMIRAKVTGKVEELKRKNIAVDGEAELIARELYEQAKELVITQYIPTMDARYETPKFISEESQREYEKINPWEDLYKGKVHGRITDGGTNRWWVKLNSGQNVTHPTHGYPIVNAPLEQGKSPSLDIRTWSEILTEPQRYAPVYLKGDEDTPFHLIRLH